MNGYKTKCLFYATSDEHSAHDLILGRTWMHIHKSQFDWEGRSINLTLGTTTVNIPAVSLTKAHPSLSEPTTTSPADCEPKKNNKGHQHNALHEGRLPNRKPQTRNFYTSTKQIWVHKPTVPSIPPLHIGFQIQPKTTRVYSTPIDPKKAASSTTLLSRQQPYLGPDNQS